MSLQKLFREVLCNHVSVIPLPSKVPRDETPSVGTSTVLVSIRVWTTTVTDGAGTVTRREREAGSEGRRD